MSKQEKINYLMNRYLISYSAANHALVSNDWDLMMAGGDIRDSLAS